MKRKALLLITIITSITLSAQVVKLDVGTTFSSMQEIGRAHV